MEQDNGNRQKKIQLVITCDNEWDYWDLCSRLGVKLNTETNALVIINSLRRYGRMKYDK